MLLTELRPCLNCTSFFHQWHFSIPGFFSGSHIAFSCYLSFVISILLTAFSFSLLYDFVLTIYVSECPSLWVCPLSLIGVHYAFLVKISQKMWCVFLFFTGHHIKGFIMSLYFIIGDTFVIGDTYLCHWKIKLWFLFFFYIWISNHFRIYSCMWCQIMDLILSFSKWLPSTIY